MPELPEVETMVRGIRPYVEGRSMVAVRRCRCRYRSISFSPDMRSMSSRAEGQRAVSVRRLAKRVIIELESGDAFVIEPRMTGLMLVSDPPDRGHLRFEWRLGEEVAVRDRPQAQPGSSKNDKPKHTNRESSASKLQVDMPPSLWFWDRRGLGTVRLYSPEQMNEALGPSRLGPDALVMTLDDWGERFGRTKRAVKVSLLDQKLVAGIGNLYASEILHLARVHPEHPSDRLKKPQLKRLAAATRTVLETAIRYEGSTLGDGTYRNALNENGSYQNEHRVYARAEETCPTCNKSTITRIVQAQRSTFFCPNCQRRKS